MNDSCLWGSSRLEHWSCRAAKQKTPEPRCAVTSEWQREMPQMAPTVVRSLA